MKPKTTICPGVGMNTFRDCFNDVLDHFSRKKTLTAEGLTLLATLPSLYFSSQPKRRNVVRAIALAETTLDSLDYFNRRQRPKNWLEKNLRVDTNDSKEIDQLVASDELTVILSANTILTTTEKMIGMVRKTMRKYPHYKKHSERVAKLEEKHRTHRDSYPSNQSERVRSLKRQILTD